MSVKSTGLWVNILGLSLLATGCSQINKVFNGDEDVVGYKEAGSVTSLEVPPDLTAPQYDSTFTVNTAKRSVSANNISRGEPGKGVEVLPDSSTVKLKGSGSIRWLEVNAPAGVLWTKVQGFWTTLGVGLRRNEPAIGIMETDWIETHGHLPQGAIQKVLGSILKNATDSGIRDRYTVRFEKKNTSLTRIYVTHRGAELVVTDLGNKWEMRPRRAAAEAEMLNRLKAYLQGVDPKAVTGNGVAEEEVSGGSAILSKDASGTPLLKIQDEYDRAWVRTGSALTQAGFTLEGQDAEKGRYVVSWQAEEEKKGFFRRLLSSNKRFLPQGSQYFVNLGKSKGAAILTVSDKTGGAVAAQTANKILERLKSELNR